jgi:methionyl aminopeptidase
MIPIKTPAEVAAMRKSCSLAASLLHEVVAHAAPGCSLEDLDRFAGERIKAAGAISAFLGYKGFTGNTCLSVNEEVVHGTPRKRKLQYGDVLSIDLGVVFEGWVGDTATTIAIGEVSPEVRHLLETTEKSLHFAIDKARAGKRLGNVSHAVEAYVTSQGFSVVREFVGHGVGRTLHEEPQIPNFGPPNQGPKLKAGMCLAIEPMVNMGSNKVRILEDGWTVVAVDGKPSAHFEHTVLVTEGDPEILTCLPREASKASAGSSKS